MTSPQEDILALGKFRNLKTGLEYRALGEVTDATNVTSGRTMVLYESPEGRWFVRDKDEFLEKFTTDVLVDLTPPGCNRHVDCSKKPLGSPCCDDDCCEECFGY